MPPFGILKQKSSKAKGLKEKEKPRPVPIRKISAPMALQQPNSIYHCNSNSSSVTIQSAASSHSFSSRSGHTQSSSVEVEEDNPISSFSTPLLPIGGYDKVKDQGVTKRFMNLLSPKKPESRDRDRENIPFRTATLPSPKLPRSASLLKHHRSISELSTNVGFFSAASETNLSYAELGKVNAFYSRVPPGYLSRHGQSNFPKTPRSANESELVLTPLPVEGDTSTYVEGKTIIFTPDSIGWKVDLDGYVNDIRFTASGQPYFDRPNEAEDLFDLFVDSGNRSAGGTAFGRGPGGKRYAASEKAPRKYRKKPAFDAELFGDLEDDMLYEVVARRPF